jgi:hypothetical protein
MSPVPVDPFPDFTAGSLANPDQVDARFLELYKTLDPAQRGVDKLNTNPTFAKDDVEPGFSGWKRYGELLGGAWAPGGGNGTFLLFPRAGAAPATLGANGSVAAIMPQLDPADFARGARTVRFRLKQTLFIGAVAPGVAFSTWMARMSVWSGPSGTTPAVTGLNAEQLGAITVSAAAATANTRVPSVGTEFALPAAADYVVACQVGGTLPAGAAPLLLVELQYRQI